MQRVLVELAATALLVAVLITAWWAWIEMSDISPLVIPRPAAVWDDLRAVPGDHVSATGATLAIAGIALVIGAAAG